MNIKNKCKQCGKCLLSPHQLKLRKYIGEGWDKKTIHYKCWTEKQYKSDLATITEGMLKLNLNDQTNVALPPPPNK